MRSPGAVAVVVLVVVAACSRPPADPVAALLQELEEAAEARDADRFAARLSPAFRADQGLGRAEALAELRRYFAAYESVTIEVHGLETERDESGAHVRCVVEFSGTGLRALGVEGLLPASAVYRFELDAAVEGGVWRVKDAAWAPAEPEEG
jgi:hypothetical protein